VAERDLEVRANRMDLVSRWADDLAHEIKNPLHAMVINLELVKRRAGGPDADAVVDRVAVVEAEVHRVHGLVEALLRLVRPWPVASVADVDRVFSDLLPALLVRSRIRKIEFEHRAGGGAVAMPPGLLALVLLNLADNAFEATPEQGRVETACETRDGQVWITVRDTGTGVPPELASRVFEPGVTQNPGRSGLGLAIARRLVEEAGGTLTIEPGAEGGGALATVVLPAVGAA
jgi:two-component system, NtrC family, sensor kinase